MNLSSFTIYNLEMTIEFKIEYRTKGDEVIAVVFKDSDIAPLFLNSYNDATWSGVIAIEGFPANSKLEYSYAVYENGECTRIESGVMTHSIWIGESKNTKLYVRDTWRDLPEFAYLFSSAFSGDKVFVPYKGANTNKSNTIFRALVPHVGNGKRVAICGREGILGGWKMPLPMKEIAPFVWECGICADYAARYEFKFVIIDKNGIIVEWERGENRELYVTDLAEGEVFYSPEMEPLFDSLNRKIAGTAIPVFSLRGEGSFGVGDFGDLKDFVAWAAHTHQKGVQILPINDTTISNTWTDSYPYNSISIYAFHPMYLDIRQLGTLRDKNLAAEFEVKRRKLNASPFVDYEGVNSTKMAYIKALFRQNGKRVLASVGFKKFFEDNSHWLLPYAAFSYLRDINGTPDFNAWGEYAVYNEERIKDLCSITSEAYPSIALYYYIQYNLHIQLLEVSKFARSKNVILKGDIPIGISRCSVEAWIEPHYFNMNGQAGAPPDAFSTNGQNWGFPTYNWDVMEKDGYAWWRKRFSKMSEYFTAYRIDHILGFFRIWEIPTHSVHGLLGQFVPAKGMTTEEIAGYGLEFRPQFMTTPFIDDEILSDIFGDNSDFVKDTFLLPLASGRWELRPEFDTQRKVESWCWHNGCSEEIREGVYSLISNVLFVPDRNDTNLYHPRICVQNDYIYKQLTTAEQNAFNALYDYYYYHRHSEFWYKQAMKKLPMLTQCTPMLACGEDLGMVPECVPWVMNQLQILSLEIERMPKAPYQEFGNTYYYPLRSVCSISTHDMSTLRGWWEENPEVTDHYYRTMLNHGGATPHVASADICEEVVCRHLYSPSLLAILSFQDWLSIDENIRFSDVEAERINIPAVARHHWRYRMHVTIEQLMANEGFTSKLRSLIDNSGRG